MDVWIIRPDESLEWELTAQCCFCSDKSFPKKISGGFSYKGITDASHNSITLVNDISINNESVLFTIGKP